MPLPQPCQRLLVQTGEGTRQLQREWRCAQAAGNEQSLSSGQDHRKPDCWEAVIGFLWRPKYHQSIEGGCLWSHRSTALRIMLATHPWKALEGGLGTTKAGWGRERKKIRNQGSCFAIPFIYFKTISTGFVPSYYPLLSDPPLSLNIHLQYLENRSVF